ncbi:hypothetical protein ACMD2_25222 [Ananas comosus]|uniref:Uncharacterized protein n=1 Tax=Ananas comosus TaxID=4615 RepID=A0A199VXZ9_ANACO|nr:hypothetical protein ACMD2_25222 [Ananas comosus]
MVDFPIFQDMVAFSCCIFDGGEVEKQDMNAARERVGEESRINAPRMASIYKAEKTMIPLLEIFVTTQGGTSPFSDRSQEILVWWHSKTIKPDKRKLAVLFANPNIGWKALKRQLLNMRAHSDAKGIEIKRPNDSLYTFPCPDCMCRSNKTEVLKSLQAR